MIGNSRLPGVATEPRHAARATQNQTINATDAAMRWAADACVPGEYTETLLPALLWAITKAAAVLEPIERQLRLLDRPRAPRAPRAPLDLGAQVPAGSRRFA